jgi:hypothetical protein
MFGRAFDCSGAGPGDSYPNALPDGHGALRPSRIASITVPPVAEIHITHPALEGAPETSTPLEWEISPIPAFDLNSGLNSLCKIPADKRDTGVCRPFQLNVKFIRKNLS